MKRIQRRRAVVGDAKGDGICARPLQLRRRPGEHAVGGVDGGPAGRTGIQAEGQELGGQIRIAGAGCEGEQATFINRLIADGKKSQKKIRFV